VAYVAVAQTSLFVQDWLHRQLDAAGIGRTISTNARMRSLLTAITPTAARVRVSRLHRQPVTGGVLGYKGNYAIASPNHNLGIIGNDVPLTAFANELTVLLAGNCTLLTQQVVNQIPERSATIVCPIAGNAHRPVGLLNLSWDKGDPVPENFAPAMAAAKQAALDIAGIWAIDPE
jgi:hypothetical protein